MKRWLVFAAVFLALASAGIGAAASSYWDERGSTYDCKGYAPFAICMETNRTPRYQIAIENRYVTVLYNGHIIFDCLRRYRPTHNCQSYGR